MNATASSTASPAPFDAAAEQYDASFTQRSLGRWLREMVWQELDEVACAGDHVLELGCGTGEDARWLASRGCRVIATDSSTAMLEVAREKTALHTADQGIRYARLDLNHLRDDAIPANGTLDGIFANFGVLNCVVDRPALWELIAAWLKPGGWCVLVPMGPFCPWEIGWHLLHAQPRAAFRRFRGGIQAHAGAGAYVTVWYPSAHRLRRELAPSFQHVRTVGIGTLLPPSYLAGLTERYPAMFGKLARADRRLRQSVLSRWLNDHYLIVLRRR